MLLSSAACVFLYFRVNKKWYNFITKSSAWRVINFYDEGPEEEEVAHLMNFVPKEGKEPAVCRKIEKWQFPRESDKDISKFLSRYAGIALQELYLPVTSKRIVGILQQNCPNIHTLSYRHGYLDPGGAAETIYYPPKLQSINLQAPPTDQYERDTYIRYPYDRGTIGMFDDECNEKLQRGCEESVNLLSQCKDLHKLTLKGYWLTQTSMQKLVKNTNLKEIDFVTCIPSGVTNIMTRSKDMKGNFHRLLDDILAQTIGILDCVTRFRLIGSGIRLHSLEAKYPGCDHVLNLLDCIGQWKHLKVLALKYVRYSTEVLADIIPGLPNIESLELEGPSISSGIVSLIGTHLKKLEFLSLQEGDFAVESLQFLSNHPSLKILWILYDWNLKSSGAQFQDIDFCRSIYSVLATLPKIKKVTLRGYEMSHLFEIRKSYPGLESIEIEVQDKDKYHFMWDFWMSYPLDPYACIIRGPLNNC